MNTHRLRGPLALLLTSSLLLGCSVNPATGRNQLNFFGEESEIEIRQVFEAEDFGEAFTPEARAQEDRLRAQIEERQK